jgi:FKBP-type peptidyl-prolyl cis-trans isomerase FklB
MKSAKFIVLGFALACGQVYAFNSLNSQYPGSSGYSGDSFVSTQQKLGYALGLEMGNSFKRLSIELDPYAYMLGMKDAMSGSQVRMAEQDMKSTLISFRREMMARTPGYEALKEKNQREGEAFLATNKKKQGVITLTDGLQYKIINSGKGEKPSAKDIVSINYVGTLVNGTVFDSSFKRGKPMIFQLDSMIPGWTEALQLMPVGATWDIFVPSSLAYNELGSQPDVGPNQTLIFRITMLGIQEKHTV